VWEVYSFCIVDVLTGTLDPKQKIG